MKDRAGEQNRKTGQEELEHEELHQQELQQE
jgi:hypothetical protein